MSDPSACFLAGEQLRTRFEEQEREFLFDNHEPQETPALIPLSGQTAAGKGQTMAATIVLLAAEQGAIARPPAARDPSLQPQGHEPAKPAKEPARPPG
ncbi:hypothetical protein [Streptomyces hydrogenans]|uniref:hypothetical protein n=1 Tax=Streptomyces hydrogenans TaxID=1873719 RepID=UPI00167EF5AE|nr:hypothetical protein [Streptomyces hydrogenans]GHE32304.1 hypothetical protein GCM10018784_80830 [Streptomyces hydrogenans]